MYIDKDSSQIFSIMDIRYEELSKLSVILREFEFMIHRSDMIDDVEKGALSLLSARIRFKIIDALK
jgi:hypothetical protein